MPAKKPIHPNWTPRTYVQPHSCGHSEDLDTELDLTTDPKQAELTERLHALQIEEAAQKPCPECQARLDEEHAARVLEGLGV